MAKIRKRSWKNSLFIVVAILFILACILFFLIANNLIDKKTIISNFQIGQRPGFDLNSSALTFGSIPPGACSSRNILLKNDFKEKVFISVTISKILSDFVTLSENNFYLSLEEQKELAFSVCAPKNASFAEHSGVVVINIKRNEGLF